jgi:arylsulfatase A
VHAEPVRSADGRVPVPRQAERAAHPDGSSGLILEPGSATLPALMKQAGFATAVVGKWQLGLGASPTQYNGIISPGP